MELRYQPAVELTVDSSSYTRHNFPGPMWHCTSLAFRRVGIVPSHVQHSAHCRQPSLSGILPFGIQTHPLELIPTVNGSQDQLSSVRRTVKSETTQLDVELNSVQLLCSI